MSHWEAVRLLNHLSEELSPRMPVHIFFLCNYLFTTSFSSMSLIRECNKIINLSIQYTLRIVSIIEMFFFFVYKYFSFYEFISLCKMMIISLLFHCMCHACCPWLAVAADVHAVQSGKNAKNVCGEKIIGHQVEEQAQNRELSCSVNQSECWKCTVTFQAGLPTQTLASIRFVPVVRLAKDICKYLLKDK